MTPDDHWPEDEFVRSPLQFSLSSEPIEVHHLLTIVLCAPCQEDEFDDYESPYSGDEKASGSDYESPNEDDYEPTPSEPPEDMNLFPTRPIGDGHYIGTNFSTYHVATTATTIIMMIIMRQMYFL